MNIINKEQHDELIKILSELIETIVIMRKEEKDYVLAQNENEAREWISFLKELVLCQDLVQIKMRCSAC